jgi:tetratricopeptide (TPR) repeat protein
MNSPRLARAKLLYSQSRYELAVGELSLHLAETPDDVDAHCLLALCFSQLERYDEATEQAKLAIAAAPDFGGSHYVFAAVMIHRNRLDAAQQANDEAIRLDPDDPDYFTQRSLIYLRRQKWKEALDAADQALALDPEEEEASNLRSMALVKLNRTAQAAEQIQVSLERNPDNAWTHANRGWAYLETKEIDKALEHFREALRLDPSNDYARHGMVQALMARHLLYRWFLGYLLWMSKLSNQMQWAVIIGLFVVFNYSDNLAVKVPALAPFIFPLQVAYIVFAWFSWVATPLFQLLLRFNRFGKFVLSKDETRSAHLFGGLVLLAIALGIGAIALQSGMLLLSAFYALTLSVCASVVFRCPPGQPRWLMAAYTLAMAGIAIGSTVAMFNPAWEVAWGNNLHNLYILGIIGTGFVANALMSWTPRK